MRGAQNLILGLIQDIRIIPADAGSTAFSHWCASPIQDHPRGCGEHMRMCIRRTSRMGSSPRMRGAHTFFTTTREVLRIIPADAGSTWNHDVRMDAKGDHPRGCGEHVRVHGLHRLPGGSSPRMRGAQCPIKTVCQSVRIIPADAGSTAKPYPQCRADQDHPRGCGEHLHSIAHVGSKLGSSPRMRGAPSLAPATILVIRIIPADAGST